MIMENYINKDLSNQTSICIGVMFALYCNKWLARFQNRIKKFGK